MDTSFLVEGKTVWNFSRSYRGVADKRRNVASRRFRRSFFEALEDRRLLTTVLRLANWNVFQNAGDANAETILEAIGNETVQGNTGRIAVLALQETNASDALGMQNALNDLYDPGCSASCPYTRTVSPTDDGSNAQAFVWDTSQVTLLSSSLVGTTQVQTRRPIRGEFRPVGTAGSDDFYYYSIHLKAGGSSGDQMTRADEAEEIRDNADLLPEGTNIIMAGDFNWDSSSENAFTKFADTVGDPGPGAVNDPVNRLGSWNNNSGFRDLHSQATQAPGGAGGGLDDRFDMHLTSNELSDGSGLEYVTGSYRVFGNNGTHPLNGAITSGTGASPTVLAALNVASDHLPTVMDIELTTPAPEIDVLGNSMSITDGDTTPSPADHTDFGATDVAGGNVVRFFTVRNDGSADLTLSAPVISGTHASDFTVTGALGSTLLTAGQTTNFQVTFNPSASGLRSAEISMGNNDTDENPYNFSIQGTGTTAAEIDVLGNGLTILDGDTTPSTSDHTDFGDVLFGGTLMRTFTVENDGSADLTLSPPVIGGVDAGDFNISAPLGSTLLMPGQSTTFEVTFNPGAAGIKNANISLGNSDSNEDPYNFDIAANASNALISFEDATINIPSSGNVTEDISVFLNTTNASILGYTVIIDIQGPGGTAVGTGLPTGVSILSGTDILAIPGPPPTVQIPPAGGLADFSFADFAFTPTTVGADENLFDFELQVDSTAQPGTLVTLLAVGAQSIVNLDFGNDVTNVGTPLGSITLVTGPEVDIEGNGTSIADGDTTPNLADHTDFGDADITSGSVVRTFTVQNEGDADLTLGAPVIGGTHAADFTVTQALGSTLLSAGQSTTFQVTFDPSATGTRSAEISITNNDANENPYNFSIQGNGTAQPEIDVLGNAQVIVDGDVSPSLADHTDFGDTLLNVGFARTFTVENNGTGDLTLSAPSIGGADASQFSISAPLGSTLLMPGQSTTFEVTFTPTSEGAKAASISLGNNDSDENPYDFDIAGNGSDALISFEDVTIGIPAAGTVTEDISVFLNTTNATILGYTVIIDIQGPGGTNVGTGLPQGVSILSGTDILPIAGPPPTVQIPPAGGLADFSFADFAFTPTSVGADENLFDFELQVDSTALPGTSITLLAVGAQSIINLDFGVDVTNLGTPLGSIELVVPTGPEIDVEGNSTSIADGDTTPDLADHTDFGSADFTVGGSVARTYTVQNEGTSNLTLSAPAIGGTHAADFAITQALGSTTLTPGQSTTFEVTFTPSAAGQRDATISLGNNDADEDPYDFAIRGTGADLTSPTVTDVIIRNSSWTDATFIDTLDEGRDDGLGLSLTGPDQLRSLPWKGLNEIRIVFSEDVGTLTASDVQLSGVFVTDYDPVSTVSYDAPTQTGLISLSTPIDIDKLLVSVGVSVTDLAGNPLDGGTGDLVAGGQFDFRFNVLPGDSDNNGTANTSDVFAIFGNSGSTTGTLALAYQDLDANGTVNTSDVFLAFGDTGDSLPVGDPTPPTPPLAQAPPMTAGGYAAGADAYFGSAFGEDDEEDDLLVDLLP